MNQCVRIDMILLITKDSSIVFLAGKLTQTVIYVH